MPINLTTPFVIPNGARLVIDDVHPIERKSELVVVIQLRTPGATDNIISEKVLTIRNGVCDRVTRGTIAALQRFDDLLVFEPGALTVAAGYDNAMNAWKAGATIAARKTALETHMLSVGYIHATLTGT